MNKKRKKIKFRVHRDYIKREAQNFRDHKKGIPEWIKNSDDSYTRKEDSLGKDFEKADIIINLDKNHISCLDLGGGEFKKIEKNLFNWGDPTAATQGEELKNKIVSGGHGNGGKYYALSQFEKCKIINYYEGKLSVFVIEDEGDYIEIENEYVDPYIAIEEAEINKFDYLKRQNKELLDNIKRGKSNFFCWKGIGPKDKIRLSNRRAAELLISSIANNPQSRSALKSRKVDILLNGRLFWPDLTPEKPEIDEKFGVREFNLPNKLGNYEFNKNFNSILKVYLSKKPLTGEKSSMNILEISSFANNIAYYNIPDLMMDKSLSKSMIANIDCPELKKDYGCVSNERVHLIEGLEVTSLFLNWCRSKVREVLDELTDKERKIEEKSQLRGLRNFIDNITEEISELLEEDNIIKPDFSKLGNEITEVEVPTDKEGYGGEGKVENKGGGKRKGGKENKEGASEKKKGKSKLKILLSNHDSDPLNPKKTYEMIERQPILDQRIQDVDHGIWWLNTQKRYVRKLNIEKNPELTRIFVLFLTKEIILSHKSRRRFKEQIRYDPDGLEEMNFDLIDNIFGKVVDRLGIEISVDQKMAERIRNSIKNKNKFTISKISGETGADPGIIHLFIGNPNNHVLENFKVEKKSKLNGRGGSINVYSRK
jgi:hypothetical protein